MRQCKKCGNEDNYNFVLNIGLCNPCIGAEIEQLQAKNERLKERIFEAARSAIGKYDPNAPPLTKNKFANELVEALRTES